MRIARHAGVIEVGSAVTRRTGHAGDTVTILAAHDQRLMQPPQVRLTRPLACGMAIHAGWMLQNLGSFLEQGNGTRLGISDFSEALRRAQFIRQVRPIGVRSICPSSKCECCPKSTDAHNESSACSWCDCAMISAGSG
jgi:hypothetical protein